MQLVWLSLLLLSGAGLVALLVLTRRGGPLALSGAPDGDDFSDDDDLDEVGFERGPSQRYVFSHVVLAQAFFDDPVRVVQSLSGAEAEALDFLGALWGRVGEGLGLAPRQPHGLGCSSHELAGGTSLVLIEPPAPLEASEAHMVALVLPPGELPRYFTLEHGSGPLEPGTYLCEWTRDRTHLNHGEGPRAEMEAFLSAVQANLETPAQPAHEPR